MFGETIACCVVVQLMRRVHQTSSSVSLVADASQHDLSVTASINVAIILTNATAVSI